MSLGDTNRKKRTPAAGLSRRRRIATADEALESRQSLIKAACLLLALLVIGAIGFMLFGTGRSLFDAIYITVVILTTVGMKEGGMNLNAAEQSWALLLMLAGIFAAFYAGANLVAFIVEGDLNRILGRRQLKKQIDQLNQHFIVCGFGRMGSALCESLASRDVNFILVEQDPEKAAEADRMGYLCIQGDAMNEDTLERARIHQASGLATCITSDADNVFVTLIAREFNEELKIISRAESQNTEGKLRRAGADRVICPPVISATKVTQMLLNPAVDELVDMAVTGADIEVSKLRMGELPGAMGKSLRELDLRNKTGLMVVAIVHADGSRDFSPAPESVLNDGDECIVVGQQGGVATMLELFGEA